MSMTKEQAIETIEEMVKSYIEADECGLSNNDFKYEIRAMQTVLNMLKEKDEEIENAYWKGYIQRQNEAAEICKICKYRKKYKDLEQKKSISEQFSKELDIKDKQIDLMAECIDVELSSARLSVILNKNVKPLETYKECIKQYFESKAEKE